MKKLPPVTREDIASFWEREVCSPETLETLLGEDFLIYVDILSEHQYFVAEGITYTIALINSVRKKQGADIIKITPDITGKAHALRKEGKLETYAESFLQDPTMVSLASFLREHYSGEQLEDFIQGLFKGYVFLQLA